MSCAVFMESSTLGRAQQADDEPSGVVGCASSEHRAYGAAVPVTSSIRRREYSLSPTRTPPIVSGGGSS